MKEITIKTRLCPFFIYQVAKFKTLMLWTADEGGLMTQLGRHKSSSVVPAPSGTWVGPVFGRTITCTSNLLLNGTENVLILRSYK